MNKGYFSNLADPDELKRTEEHFIDEFFDSRGEYEDIVGELYNSDIPELLIDAEDEFPHRYELYDGNRYICERYFAYTRKHEPEIVVESGVHNGVSTLVVLYALTLNGTGSLYSVSHPDESKHARPQTFDDSKGEYNFSEVTPASRGRPSCAEPGSYGVPEDKEIGWLIPDQYRNRWEHHLGNPVKVLPSLLNKLGAIDLFIHDSHHSISNMLFEFKLAFEWLQDGGAIFSHHICWNEAFSTFIQEHDCEYGFTDIDLASGNAPRYTILRCSGYIVANNADYEGCQGSPSSSNKTLNSNKYSI